jgi:hypothetical protein
MVFQPDKAEERADITMRGLVFFQIHTHFAFESFPETVPVSIASAG